MPTNPSTRSPDVLPSGPAYLAGLASRGRTFNRDNPHVTELWALDDGILLGAPDVARRSHTPLGEEHTWHTRTSEAATAEQARRWADDDPAGRWLPWSAIVAAKVDESPAWATITLTLDDGTELIRRRQGVPTVTHQSASGWETLLARLAHHVADTHVARWSRADRRWWQKAVLFLLVVIPVVFLAALGTLLHTERRMFDAPVERWEAGVYDADDPVAHVYADTVVDLPLWQWAVADHMWVESHDTILTSRTDGPRPAASEYCWRLWRSDDGQMGWEEVKRYSCASDDGPAVGLESVRVDAWLTANG